MLDKAMGGVCSSERVADWITALVPGKFRMDHCLLWWATEESFFGLDAWAIWMYDSRLRVAGNGTLQKVVGIMGSYHPPFYTD